MPSTGDIGEAIRRAVHGLPNGELLLAAEAIEDAATALHQATDGTTALEPVEAVRLLHWSRETLDTVFHTAAAIRQHAANLADGYGSAPTSRRSPPTPIVSDPQPDLSGRAITLDDLRLRLPPPGDRDRTRGAWINDDGQWEGLTSGEEGPGWRAAVRRAQDLGLVRPGGVPTFARHLELKFAALMFGEGRQDAKIAINRPPCGADRRFRRSCDELLPVFLPPGATLTIIDRDGQTYVYRGAETP